MGISTVRKQCLLALFVVLLAAQSQAQIDLDGPVDETEVHLDTFGGYPVVSSEVGAEPQAVDDPETMNQVAGTCQMAGINPTDCSQDCFYGCEDPLCSWNCICACRGADKALMVAQLAQKNSFMKLYQTQARMKAQTARIEQARNPRFRRFQEVMERRQASDERF
mmetsp:Transcript_45935/g.71966  ORF Transcript_45935/g.71966 Transcript_45935/m.71966 type:complete len:165 (+) Transcript_45935:55-549(+)